MGTDLPAGDLPAGDFASWLRGMQAALRGDTDAEVPCGGCTACCTSSQFVPIGPDEADTLAHIPAALLFPAPRLPKGPRGSGGVPRSYYVLGYDERGHCPMLVDGRCSIYDHRPRTCRTYDCRIFPATGVEVDEDKPLIARQARRWRFAFPTETDRTSGEAVRAAAAFAGEHAGLLPASARPANATERAVLAVEVHDLFLGLDEGTE